MGKKLTWSLLALLALVGAGAIWYLAAKTYEIRISQAQLEQKLAERLPLTQRYPLVSVTLAQPRVHLNEDSERVDFGLNMTVNTNTSGSQLLGAQIDVSASLRYDAERGAIFLDQPVMDKLVVQGLDERRTAMAQVALEAAMASFLAQQPVYTLNASDTRQRVARMAVRDIKVENGVVVLILGL
ncbi:MAG: DUF1439 domain-containing protein [Comamonas sp.]